MFQQADKAAAAGNGGVVDQAAADAAKASADAAAASGPLDYKTLLLTLLDLDPATADDAAIKTAFDAEEAEPEDDIAALKTQAANAGTLQKQLDDLQLQCDDLNKKQTDLYRQKQEADADEILKVYEGHFVDDASKAAIRNILLSDKEAGIAILNGLKKPDDAAAPSDTTTVANGTPPNPQHDQAAQQAAQSEQELADKISARAREIVKASNPKVSMTKAYAQAERELKAAA